MRHFRKPRIEQFPRISIGTDAPCQALVQALHQLFSAEAGAAGRPA
ncbi:histidinol-phosphate/aromatic aminotransferase/cobyric acid decarboxylase-like protein [Janthinobacterium sp. CG_23.3]|nr:histidinol-phosphate/aromatic aminotransferase/cobyric acid decarboxylase-like protein [Janthinobacterium sp. CG_S6]